MCTTPKVGYYKIVTDVIDFCKEYLHLLGCVCLTITTAILPWLKTEVTRHLKWFS